MKNLSLPPFDYQVKKQNGQIRIFDIIRKRYVVLTPEEWVRQHFIHFLITCKHYPPQLIVVEKEILVCGNKRRFDLVCYDRRGNPYLVVECKAPSVPLSQLVFDQVFQYNLSLAARFVAITNGCDHFCGEICRDEGFQIIPGIPDFDI